MPKKIKWIGLLAVGLLVAGLIGAYMRGSGQSDEELRALLGTATRLHIRSGGTCHRNVSEENTFLNTTNRTDIQTIVYLIRIDSANSGFHCMCCGNPTLEFYRGEMLIASLGFHHGRSLRWVDGKWKGDGLLTKKNADELIQWLDQHGVHAPKAEREEAAKDAELSRVNHARWITAMPEAIQPLWEKLGDNRSDEGNIQILDQALRREYSDPKQQILVLLGWYGAGAGPWSGYPAYESIAESLLLLFDTQAIVEAAQSVELTEQQIEGTARLLAGWDFSQLRPTDLERVPSQLKQRLLNHSLKSADEDKLSRARAAFAD